MDKFLVVLEIFPQTTSSFANQELFRALLCHVCLNGNFQPEATNNKISEL